MFRSVLHSIQSNCRAATHLFVLTVFLTLPMMTHAGVVHLTDLVEGNSGQDFGGSVCGLGDFNGDGRDDILVGAPGESNTGAAFLWYGSTNVTHAPADSLYGVAQEKFGFSVALIGDVNDDGNPDFAVGAPLYDAGGTDRGRVCIFYGGGTLSHTPDLVIAGVTGGDQFGFSVAAAGDFDGDGNDDFIVGAPYYSFGSVDRGAAYIIYGNNGDPSTDLADATLLVGEVATDHFGWSVCAAGNFLAGEPCVAVGAPGHDSLGTDGGMVCIFEGSHTPDAVSDHTLSVSGTAFSSQYGWVVRNAGRWDNDGYDDLAVGAPTNNTAGTDAGRVEIIFGDANPSSTGDRYVTGESGGHQLGYSLDNLGDFTGNNRHDLLIGAPFHAMDGANSGRAYIFEGGSSSGTVSVLDAIHVDPLMTGTQAQDLFGFAVAGVGDFDGDGFMDYVVGAPSGNIENNATAGYCRLLVTDSQTVGTLNYHLQTSWTPSGDVELLMALPWASEQIIDLEVYRLQGFEQLVYQGSANMLLAHADAPEDSLKFGVVDHGPFIGHYAAVSYRVRVQIADGSIFHLVQKEPLAMDQRPVPLLLMARQAWPNPANPRTSLDYRVAPGVRFTLNIHDLRGRRVRRLADGSGTGLWLQSTWEGDDDAHRILPSGLYFFHLRTEDRLEVRKVILAR